MTSEHAAHDAIPQKIDIVKGFVTDHERDALIAAIIAVSLGAVAVTGTYVVKKRPQLLSAWKMATDSRLGQSFQDMKLRYAARKND